MMILCLLFLCSCGSWIETILRPPPRGDILAVSLDGFFTSTGVEVATSI